MNRTAAIVLAAGESTRMGRLKALLPWGATTLLGHAITSMTAAGYGPIVVVLGHEAEQLRPEIPSWASWLSAQGPSASDPMHLQSHEGRTKPIVVVNEHHHEGRATSVVAGVEALTDQAFDSLAIGSVDQPRSVVMLRALREAFSAWQPHPLIGIPVYEERAGHPVLFDASLMSELHAVTEEREGLREVVGRHYVSRLLIPTDDPLTLTNINTWDDYERALELV